MKWPLINQVWGADAIVGAGAVVIDNMAPGVTVAGVRARVIQTHPSDSL